MSEKKRKNGIIFGKFYPLHLGHVNFIQKASGYVDDLYVVVCTDEKRDKKLFEKSNMKKIPTERDRIRFVKKTFKYQKNIKVIHLVEDEIAPYPNGWKDWSKRVKILLEKNNIKINTVFTNEPQDVINYKKNFINTNENENVFDNNLEIKTIDTFRDNFNISATEIRNSPYENWEYIPKAVKEFFTLKIAIIGTKKSGKTNLVYKLSNYYNTTFVEEYRKKYVEENKECVNYSLQGKEYEFIV
mgnify:CR=1 FL=1